MTYKGFIFQSERNEIIETKGIEVTVCNNKKGKYACLVISSNHKLLDQETEINKQVLEYFFKRSVDIFLDKSERSFRKYNYTYEFILGIHVAFRHYYGSYGTDSIPTAL